MLVICSGLQAQNKLYLHAIDGTRTSLSLDGIRKLTFPSRTITVYQNDGSTQLFPFAELRQARFTEFLSGNNALDIPESNNLTVFPSPVNNEMTLSLTSSISTSIEIRIVDIHGKTVSIRKERILPGNNQITMQLSELSQGLYICRVNNGRSIEIRKFLKN
ncbi:MAG: T9SS type A sorting domain-containing protein [Candidatus Saccharibacteria bacterium]